MAVQEIEGALTHLPGKDISIPPVSAALDRTRLQEVLGNITNMLKSRGYIFRASTSKDTYQFLMASGDWSDQYTYFQSGREILYWSRN